MCFATDLAQFSCADPSKLLESYLVRSLQDRGEAMLPLYPWDAPPRALQEPKVHRTRMRQRRRKSHDERRRSGSTLPKSILDEGGSGSSFKDADCDGEGDPQEDDEQIEEDEDGDVAWPKSEQRELFPGEEEAVGSAVASLKGMRVMHCSRCGSRKHFRPRCDTGDVRYLLLSSGVLPGQFDLTAKGKRILANRSVEYPVAGSSELEMDLDQPVNNTLEGLFELFCVCFAVADTDCRWCATCCSWR